MPPKKPIAVVTEGGGDDNTSLLIRLAKIETLLSTQTEAIVALTAQIEKLEEKRSEQWLEYVKAHDAVVNDCEENTKQLTVLETTVNKLTLQMNQEVRDIKDKIMPVISAYKILVWVAVFFATSIGALIWALITHSVEILRP